MTDIAPTGTLPRHFTQDEEEALRRGEGTNAILRRDTKIGVDLHGIDPTRRQVAERQKGAEGYWDVGELGKAVLEGVDFLELHAVEGGLASLGAAGALPLIGSSVGGLLLGAHQIAHAHANAKEQSAAITRDQAHVAVLGALDLPDSYKEARFRGALREVPRDFQSTAFRMTEALKNDKPGLATLQLHCDRGMNAARDLARSGIGFDAFLAANPKVADAYAKDAAFHEGFDAYRFAQGRGPDAAKDLDRRLDERDGWYARSEIAFRV